MILMDCNSAVLGSILTILKNILNFIWIAGPILAIISLAINITMLVKDPDDKKIPKKIKNSVLALVLLFMVPTIVNAAMYMLDDSIQISACWNVNRKINSSPSYINPHGEEKRRGLFNILSDYEKGEKRVETGNYSGDYGELVNITSCGNLEYCNRFLTSLYNKSRILNEAIVKNNAPVDYNYGQSAKSWDEAIRLAEHGKLVATTCVVPANWGVTDAIGSHKVLNSVGRGGFQGYRGNITKYTVQYKFDGSMSVGEAIKKGMIQPGDIIGTKAHTFAIYSVNSDGSAIVADGGHQFTVPCQNKRKCSTLFKYSARSNLKYPLYQLIRWVK